MKILVKKGKANLEVEGAWHGEVNDLISIFLFIDLLVFENQVES